ncbi:MAG: cupin domain-containing protein [Thermomicrobiales bacterium]
MVVIARMDPGDVAFRNAPSSHRGVECIFIMSGTMEAELNGRKVLLNEGDSFYFDSLIPHWPTPRANRWNTWRSLVVPASTNRLAAATNRPFEAI